MASPDPILVALTFLPALWVSVFVHEVGHALVGRAMGFVVTSFGVGKARPLFVVPLRGVRVFFCWRKPLNGLTFAYHPELLPTRLKMLAYLAGGLLVNAALALGSLAIVLTARQAWRAWFFPLCITNVWLVISAGVPTLHRVGSIVIQNDAAKILQALRSGSFAAPPALVVQGVDFTQALASSIGDTHLARSNCLTAALAWEELEDLDRARDMLERASALPGSSHPAVEALGLLVRCRLAWAGGRQVEAEAALSEAGTIYKSAGNAVGSYLVRLRLQELRLGQGNASAVAAELDADGADPLVRSRPTLDMARMSLRLGVAIRLADMAAVERLTAEYEALHSRVPAATRDLGVFRALARFHAGRGDLARAEPMYRRTLNCVREIADTWLDKAEGRGFLQRHTGVAEEARRCFLSLGKAEETMPLVAAILAPDVAAAWREEAARARDQKLRHAGLQFMLANVAILLTSLVIAFCVPRNQAVPFILTVVAISFSLVAGVLYLVYDFTIGPRIRGRRRGAGALVLVLACSPWIGLIVALAWWCWA